MLLVIDAVLHDDGQVVSGVGEELDVFERVAIDEEEVGEGTFGDDAEFARVGIAGAGAEALIDGGFEAERSAAEVADGGEAALELAAGGAGGDEGDVADVGGDGCRERDAFHHGVDVGVDEAWHEGFA